MVADRKEGADGEAADLPPCGGDGRQARGGWEGTLVFDVGFFQPKIRLAPRKPMADTPAGQHPPLPCRATPPQGGRLAVTPAFANRQRRRDWRF
ncbi:hypothetical protein EN858_11045 [Mesorhizobium sp. M4B.F.Ca.ET.215.01.1.1]|nr:hypothetical protein EOA31_29205 [Mesorhizobium sp. M4B.F.Ca.ET.049.02.1.2]RWA60964.1 MAG: hypothetical protein EOQ27_20635 [Mesorhizobium sp.]TGQ12957.1 hypothetical protein EN858_11045 [Mesorhizobium sp. M4B.F.Ca.ET.215.01.1.1]TGQ43268.1 hypothetical protein EN857_03895 [Mesorhizobium sp. M4B.F.Ca.ET.214.01.1.1]TGQ62083.1 hypothetical protein EN854_03895 [Mesorhizobium sp. M4B.F.Ca.ET.211.01.1.1]TGR06170.1 hypothetical protein EN846_10495 [Mesorhizobium sp. M4B.F.Ca.ET.203.01.1.1]TGR1472